MAPNMAPSVALNLLKIFNKTSNNNIELNIYIEDFILIIIKCLIFFYDEFKNYFA